MNRRPEHITMDALLERYQGFLFDAFGVLVRGDGALPGAIALIAHLNKQNIPYAVVTNDATRGIQTSVDRFERLGMAIARERIITSGSLISRAVRDKDLQSARAIVLGPDDTQDYAREAGLELIEPDATDTHVEVLIVGDYPQQDTLKVLEDATSSLLRAFDAGHTPTLLLPNPDLIYPRSPGHIGLTAGSIAHMLERILNERYPERAPISFEGLGKPHAMIYEEGLDRTGTAHQHTVMIGDQLVTDILGAQRFGLDNVLVTTGLITDLDAAEQWPAQPTYLLTTLERTNS